MRTTEIENLAVVILVSILRVKALTKSEGNQWTKEIHHRYESKNQIRVTAISGFWSLNTFLYQSY